MYACYPCNILLRIQYFVYIQYIYYYMLIIGMPYHTNIRYYYTGDIYSMHKLIYEDIRDSTIKQDILNYIKLQANIQHGHDMIRSRKGQNYECV